LIFIVNVFAESMVVVLDDIGNKNAFDALYLII